MAAEQSFSASFSELLATARGHFAWPGDVILYCLPPNRELLTDKIQRLCFQTYLQLCELPFETRTAQNADAMSPNGVAPFLTVRIGPHHTIFSNFEKLVLFLDAQHLGLEAGLEPAVKADNEAFISLIRTRMVAAEIHQTWICPKNANQHTALVYSSGMVWPLRKILPWLRRLELMWNDWTWLTIRKEDFLKDFRGACDALSKRLGEGDVFFESGPSSLDVLVFSHVRAVLTTPLPSNELCEIFNEYPSLSRFCETLSGRHNLPVN